MKERKIIITIDEDGKLSADTVNFQGAVCEKEMQKLLEGFEEIEKEDKKPDFYKQDVKIDTRVNSRK